MHHSKVLLFLLAQALLSTARPHNCPRPTKTCTDRLCVDYKDACGNGYGGCFLAPSCGGTWPTFTAPPCSITPTPTYPDYYPSTTTSTQCDMSICADYINSCGEMYGGCFLAPQCGGTWPTFTPPPCTTGYPSYKPPSCTYTLCADYTNSCGEPYGGCFLAPECGGTWPTFTPPPCPTGMPTSVSDLGEVTTTEVTTTLDEVTPTGDAEVTTTEVTTTLDEVTPTGDAEVTTTEVTTTLDEVTPTGDAEVTPTGDADVTTTGDAEEEPTTVDAGEEPTMVDA